MFELKLDAPSGALTIALKAETAEAVKLAVLERLARELKPSGAHTASEAAPAVTTSPRAAGTRQAAPGTPEDASAKPTRRRGGFRVQQEVRDALLVLLPAGRDNAVASDTATEWVNQYRAVRDLSPISTSSVERALDALWHEDPAIVGRRAGSVAGRSSRAIGWWRLEEAAAAEAVVASIPRVSVDRNGFEVTLEAGEGVVRGAV